MKFMIQRVTAILIVAGLLFISCSESSGNDEGDPPTVPPVESLEVSLDIFASQPKAVQQTDTTFFRAYISASIMGAFLSLNALPVEILSEVSGNTPQYNGEGEWEWTYSASGPNGAASVSLFATVDGNDVEWEFYISSSGGQVDINNILLLSGTSTLDGTEGTWNIYNWENGNVITSSDWAVSESNTRVTMNVYEGGLNIPVAVITYNYEGVTKWVSFDNNENRTNVYIEWNTETKAGFIIASDFNGGERACWDESFQDVECTPVAVP